MDYSTEIIDPFQNCQWISTDTFEGYVKNYLPFKARGHYTYINGDQVYYGEWTNGRIHKGIGIINLEISTYRSIIFIGGWKNGHMSGTIIILECDTNNPTKIDSLRYNIVDNGIITFSNELDKPINLNDYINLINKSIATLHKDIGYRAF